MSVQRRSVPGLISHAGAVSEDFARFPYILTWPASMLDINANKDPRHPTPLPAEITGTTFTEDPTDLRNLLDFVKEHLKKVRSEHTWFDREVFHLANECAAYREEEHLAWSQGVALQRTHEEEAKLASLNHWREIYVSWRSVKTKEIEICERKRDEVKATLMIAKASSEVADGILSLSDSDSQGSETAFSFARRA